MADESEGQGTPNPLLFLIPGFAQGYFQTKANIAVQNRLRSDQAVRDSLVGAAEAGNVDLLGSDTGKAALKKHFGSEAGVLLQYGAINAARNALIRQYQESGRQPSEALTAPLPMGFGVASPETVSTAEDKMQREVVGRATERQSGILPAMIKGAAPSAPATAAAAPPSAPVAPAAAPAPVSRTLTRTPGTSATFRAGRATITETGPSYAEAAGAEAARLTAGTRQAGGGYREILGGLQQGGYADAAERYQKSEEAKADVDREFFTRADQYTQSSGVRAAGARRAAMELAAETGMVTEGMKPYLPTVAAEQSAFVQDAVLNGLRKGVPPIETVRNLHSIGFASQPELERQALKDAGEVVNAKQFADELGKGVPEATAMARAAAHATAATGGVWGATPLIERFTTAQTQVEAQLRSFEHQNVVQARLFTQEWARQGRSMDQQTLLNFMGGQQKAIVDQITAARARQSTIVAQMANVPFYVGGRFSKEYQNLRKELDGLNEQLDVLGRQFKLTSDPAYWRGVFDKVQGTTTGGAAGKAPAGSTVIPPELQGSFKK